MGGQKVEIWDFAKTDHGARLVNTFYPTNGPQTSKSAEFVSMNPLSQAGKKGSPDHKASTQRRPFAAKSWRLELDEGCSMRENLPTSHDNT